MRFLLFLLILSACSNPEHNLSKGQCKNIQACEGQCNDEMTRANCEMINGEYQARELNKFWFF